MVAPTQLIRKMKRASFDPLCLTVLIKRNIKKLKQPNEAIFSKKNPKNFLFLFIAVYFPHIF